MPHGTRLRASARCFLRFSWSTNGPMRCSACWSRTSVCGPSDATRFASAGGSGRDVPPLLRMLPVLPLLPNEAGGSAGTGTGEGDGEGEGAEEDGGGGEEEEEAGEDIPVLLF